MGDGSAEGWGVGVAVGDGVDVGLGVGPGCDVTAGGPDGVGVGDGFVVAPMGGGVFPGDVGRGVGFGAGGAVGPGGGGVGDGCGTGVGRRVAVGLGVGDSVARAVGDTLGKAVPAGVLCVAMSSPEASAGDDPGESVGDGGASDAGVLIAVGDASEGGGSVASAVTGVPSVVPGTVAAADGDAEEPRFAVSSGRAATATAPARMSSPAAHASTGPRRRGLRGGVARWASVMHGWSGVPSSGAGRDLNPTRPGGSAPPRSRTTC